MEAINSNGFEKFFQENKEKFKKLIENKELFPDEINWESEENLRALGRYCFFRYTKKYDLEDNEFIPISSKVIKLIKTFVEEINTQTQLQEDKILEFEQYLHQFIDEDLIAFYVSQLFDKLYDFRINEKLKFMDEKSEIHSAAFSINQKFNSLWSKSYQFLNENFEKVQEELKSKIISPKGYDIDNLAKYYVECSVTRKKGKVSVRDLAMGSEYKKDKWSSILKNSAFIVKVWGDLHILLKLQYMDNPPEWFKKLYDHWCIELQELQKKDHANSNFSNAKQYKDYTPEEEDYTSDDTLHY